MIFESANLYVRHLVREDLDNFYRLVGDEEIMRYIRAPKTYPETAAFLEDVISKYRPGSLDLRLALVAKEGDKFIGSFAILPVDGTNEIQIGYSLLKECWGKGYSTEITKASVDYVFDVLKLGQVVALTEKGNVASQKVLLKCGFKWDSEVEHEGKMVWKYRISQ
jgi:ribosomal-protein-alanine N-acetyltransferase